MVAASRSSSDSPTTVPRLIKAYLAQSESLEGLDLNRNQSSSRNLVRRSRSGKGQTMLTRQKILLLMLKHAGRPVEQFDLMNWCFLLRHESKTAGGSSFYDFVPDKDGPFSFALDHEIKKLESMRFILSHGDQVWKLNHELVSVTAGVSLAIEIEVKRLVSEFGSYSSHDLFNSVYQQYPAFTVNSERHDLGPRPKAKGGKRVHTEERS